MSKSRKVILFVLIVGMIITLFFLTREAKPYAQMHLENKTLIKEVAEDTKETNDEDNNLLRKIDFDKLHEINPDIIGWIYIPKIDVDLPILHSEDEEYSKLDYKGNYSPLGSVFTWGKGLSDLDSTHYFLFAHHLVTGQMFGAINKLENDDSIYIYTPKYSRCYSMTEQKILHKTDPYFMKSKVDDTDNENYLTLITCYGKAGTSYRLCVIAKQTEQL